MKINFKKDCVFLGNVIKVSAKGNRYNNATLMIDGSPVSIYATEDIPMNALKFGDKLKAFLEVTYNTKYDKLQLVSYDVVA